VPRYIAITSIHCAIGSKYKQLRGVSLHKFDAQPNAAKQESYDGEAGWHAAQRPGVSQNSKRFGVSAVISA
jgi:hypothetical protein